MQSSGVILLLEGTSCGHMGSPLPEYDAACCGCAGGLYCCRGEAPREAARLFLPDDFFPAVALGAALGAGLTAAGADLGLAGGGE